MEILKQFDEYSLHKLWPLSIITHRLVGCDGSKDHTCNIISNHTLINVTYIKANESLCSTCLIILVCQLKQYSKGYACVDNIFLCINKHHLTVKQYHQNRRPSFWLCHQHPLQVCVVFPVQCEISHPHYAENIHYRKHPDE
jgi:hypothetical protein